MLIFFDKNTKNHSGRLNAISERLSRTPKIINYHKLEELEKQLCKPMQNLAAVILVANNQKELDELLSLEHLFEGIRTLMVLPMDDEVTTKRALRLHPTYYVTKEEKMDGINAVLNKIIRLQ
jgi:hypothetical protein